MSQDVENIHANIRDWLLEEGFKIEKKKNDKAFFDYAVTPKSGFPKIGVLQPKVHKDSVHIVCGIVFGGDNVKKFAELPTRERDEMLWELRKWLLLSGCRFAFSPSLDSFRIIEVSRMIYYDGLSKNSFFGALEKVMNAFFMVTWSIHRRIGIEPKKGEKETTYVS